MEKGEINYDEMYDLKPVNFPEIYSNGSCIKPQINGRTSSSSPSPPPPKTKHHFNNNNNNSAMSWNSSSSAPKLIISFESSAAEMDHKGSNLETINFSSSLSSSAAAKDNDSSSNEEYNNNPQYSSNQKSRMMSSTSSATRTPSQAQEHVVAERKRRENLSQLFISLSKVVPGLKKLDKASLLEDGIKYVKDLQERVRVLEESRSSIDGGVARDDVDDSSSSAYESSTTETSNNGGPEIEARISEKHVLIKIFGKNMKMGSSSSVIARIPSEMMEMHLNVVDMRIMPFGFGETTSLHITILAEIQREFEGAVKDIVDHLHTLFSN